MYDTTSSNFNEEEIKELAEFFDMLAMFDFEDNKTSSFVQEINKGFSSGGGESLLVSCEHDEQTS